MGKVDYVLAMYDVRGKQDYIFRTNKIKEIVGGSWVIRDIYDDYLFPAARDVSESGKGIFTYDPAHPEKDRFSVSLITKHMSEGYVGEVVYSGGGNFLVLFKDIETFRKVTYCFTRDVMKATGMLRVLATCVDNICFDDYAADRKRLYALHRKNEAEESKMDPWSCLPIVQVERKTSMPIVEKGISGDLTRETMAKRKKYECVLDKMKNADSGADYYVSKNVEVFDEMVLKKGDDSNLAVVYIDGNAMGTKVQQATEGLKSYEESVNRLREFSSEIHRTYIVEGIKNALEGENARKYRVVVYAGDEINFVVKAKDAFKCARDYLEQLGEGYSACAGIAVFHSHAPYADAYRIAEEACESGKQKMKQNKMENASFIDFHICQGAVGMSLERIREDAHTDNMSLPWLVKGDMVESASKVTPISDVDRLSSMLRKLGRSNVKGLADAAHKSEAELSLELMRIRAHQGKSERDQMEKDWRWLGIPMDVGATHENLLKEPGKLIYDVVIGYDLWFDNDDKEATE